MLQGLLHATPRTLVVYLDEKYFSKTSGLPAHLAKKSAKRRPSPGLCDRVSIEHQVQSLRIHAQAWHASEVTLIDMHQR